MLDLDPAQTSMHMSPRSQSMHDSSSSDSPTLSDGQPECAPSLPRKPIPRKGHTKSRRGCFNCKRRRIKCNEKHPECNHCIKAGLNCEYPANIIQATQRSLGSPHPQEVATLRSTPGMFNAGDMRLFHHFLITAYPHLPVGADKIWVTVIPSFAHNVHSPAGRRCFRLISRSLDYYDYLIHSILALAASHLDVVSNANVAEAAFQHRILAVKSLNEALSSPPKTLIERDARMAAALALAFQSSHIQDGMAEFLTMVRGCNLIAGPGDSLGEDSAFHAFRDDTHLQNMRARIGTSSHACVSHSDLDLAALSLHSLSSLVLSPCERSYWSILTQIIDSAYSRPVDAYTAFVHLYNVPSQWSYDEFQAFIDPANAVAQILLAHFIAVQAILTPILYLERVGFQGVDAPTCVLGWIERIYKNVPAHLRRHVEWPRQVSRYPFMRFLGQRQDEQAYFDEEALVLLG